jgi:hypothetical protein
MSIDKKSNGQRRVGAALKNKLTGAPWWRPLQINIPSRRRLHHHRLPHYRNIFSPNDNLGCPDYKRTKLFWPSATQEYQTATPQLPE